MRKRGTADKLLIKISKLSIDAQSNKNNKNSKIKILNKQNQNNYDCDDAIKMKRLRLSAIEPLTETSNEWWMHKPVRKFR